MLVLAAAFVQADPPREFRDCATCPALLEVPAGTFERRETLDGPPFPGRFEPPYALGKYAVTRAEFAAFVQATSHATSGYTLWRTFGSKQDAQATGMLRGSNRPRTSPWCA
jgi:formylglycine-generating enzyme required for sulfatase activity